MFAVADAAPTARITVMTQSPASRRKMLVERALETGCDVALDFLDDDEVERLYDGLVLVGGDVERAAPEVRELFDEAIGRLVDATEDEPALAFSVRHTLVGRVARENRRRRRARRRASSSGPWMVVDVDPPLRCAARQNSPGRAEGE